MSDASENSPVARITTMVQGMLASSGINRTFGPQDDLRAVGLTSVDLVNLALSVEAEFDVMIPERGITPANFRSVATISALVTSLLPPQ